jgi:hypothetical protein
MESEKKMNTLKKEGRKKKDRGRWNNSAQEKEEREREVKVRVCYILECDMIHFKCFNHNHLF